MSEDKRIGLQEAMALSPSPTLPSRLDPGSSVPGYQTPLAGSLQPPATTSMGAPDTASVKFANLIVGESWQTC